MNGTTETTVEVKDPLSSLIDSIVEAVSGWLQGEQQKKLEQLELEQERLELEQERLRYQREIEKQRAQLQTIMIAGGIGLAGLILWNLFRD
jgi:cell division protein FtsB